VSFDVVAAAYDRFMGRWSGPLARQFVEVVGLQAGQRALDVGCGPGALTEQLVSRLGAAAVAAVDPSASFVDSARQRLPGVDVRLAVAGRLPFADDLFDAALAQLVVHFLPDPTAGLAEMARVTRPGGVVAACVWDLGGERGPLTAFYRALHEVDATLPDQSGLPGAREGHLPELLRAAGLREVESGSLTVRLGMVTFEEWWQPFTLGVGRAGDALARLGEPDRRRVRDRCEELLPTAPFEVSASAWTARGVA
jgi:SAM-dependent methyltransferase